MKTKHLAEELLDACRSQGKTLASAESCTGGGIGHLLTSISGSSSVFVGGVISYTNDVKRKLLRVPQDTLDRWGAVSAQTAEAMAMGVCVCVDADVGISVTGLAGPNSDDSGKPVGLVYVGVSDGKTVIVQEHHFSGDREAVREQAVEAALMLALDFVQ